MLDRFIKFYYLDKDSGYLDVEDSVKYIRYKGFEQFIFGMGCCCDFETLHYIPCVLFKNKVFHKIEDLDLYIEHLKVLDSLKGNDNE